MTDIQSLVDKLQLQPHVEGGFYRETYRSKETINNSNDDERHLSTLIYFLLPSGRYSKFHKIASDEIWLYQQGDPVAIHILLEDGTHKVELLGHDIANGQQLQVIIPAGTLFGAEVIGDNTYALSACMVSPGFDFEDFQLMEKDVLIKKFPQHIDIINHLHQ
jgi:predicted cupin superfamily sugar epimerase